MSVIVNSISEDWDRYSIQEHRVVYTRPSHTDSEPRVVIFTRKPRVVNGSDLGSAKFSIKIVNGDLDADSIPTGANTLAQLDFSSPGVNGADVLTDLVYVARAVLLKDTIMDDLKTGLLPQGITL